MEQINISEKGNNAFRVYLNTSMNNTFTLDSTNCSIIECAKKMCEIKSRSHPNIMLNYRMLIIKLENLEKKFNCKIMSNMISSIFWNHFIPFLADQELKYSSIGHIKTTLLTVLN